MKIRSLLVIACLFFSCISTLVFSLYIHNQDSSAAEKQYDELIREMAEKQSGNMSLYLSSIDRGYTLIAENPDLKLYLDKLGESGSASVNMSDTEEYARVKELLAAYVAETSASGVAVFRGTNEIMAMEGDIKDVFDASSFYGLEENRYVVFSASGESKNVEYRILATKSLGNSYRIAALFEPTYLKMIFDRSNFQTNGRLILFDPDDNVLDSNSYLGNLANAGYADLSEYKKQIANSGHTYGPKAYTYEVTRAWRSAYFLNVGETGWKLLVVGEAEGAYAQSSEAIGTIALLAVFFSFFCAVISISMVLVLTKPLHIIQDTLTKINRGDHEARMPGIYSNEYGEIAKSFNDLLDDVVVSEGRYRTIIEMSDNIIFEWNFETGNVSFSNNFNRKFSYRAPSDSYEDSFLLKCKVHPEDADRYRRDLEKLSRGETFLHNEYRWKNIYGDYIWILMRTSTLNDAKGNILKVVGVIIDIDRAKKSEKILTARASYDALTGLYNRETAENLINNEIDLITARKNEFAILFLDVDDFKQYNDNYSHATGDQVLKFVAATINDVVSQYGISGRYGGDEFVICVRNSETNDPAKAASEILARLKEGFVCDLNERLTVAVSIGIAIINDSSKRVDEIIGMADDAMYKIKKSGKASYGFIT